MQAAVVVVLALATLTKGSVLVSHSNVAAPHAGPAVQDTHEKNADFDRRERWMHPSAPYRHQGVLSDSADDHGDNDRPLGPTEEWETSFWRNKGKASVEELTQRKDNTNTAKNLIIFLGDGMSIPTLAATRVLMGNENKQLSFDKFPAVGLSKTYCVDSQVADSACSSTAYLCGVKANIGTMGVNARVIKGNCSLQQDADNHVDSVLSWGQQAGKWAGIVTTTRVTHASPGGAYAHIADRDWEHGNDGADPTACSDIAQQLVFDSPGKDFRVVLGGGRRAFIPKSENAQGRRLDGMNLVTEWKKSKAGAKYAYVEDKAGLDNVTIATTDYLLGLFQWSHMDYHLDAPATQPTLADLTRTAIQMLSKQEKGFVLFVEGGRIDHGHHDDQAHYALDETVQFSQAVQAATELTKEEETLIVVTADHAHTMSMAGYAQRNNDIFKYAGKGQDKIPYTTLSYANGPGYKKEKNNTRHDPSKDENDESKYEYPATAPLSSETHGGDDVGIFARGPWAHLYTGVHEQNVIPHIMAYAAGIGPFKDRATSSATTGHQAALLSTVLTPLLCKLLM